MIEVEITVDDAIVRFDDKQYEPNLGDVLNIHEAGATFLILKGWARIRR